MSQNMGICTAVHKHTVVYTMHATTIVIHDVYLGLVLAATNSLSHAQQTSLEHSHAAVHAKHEATSQW